MKNRRSVFLRIAVPFLSGVVMASLVHLSVQPLGWGLVAVVMGLVSLLLFNSGRSSSCFACLFAFVGGAFVTTLNREYATGAPPADYMKYDAVVMSTPQRHGKVVGFDALVVDVADRRVSPFMAKVSIAGLDTCRLGIGSGIEALSVFTVPGQRKDSKIPVQRKAATASERRFDYSRYLQTQGFRAQTFVYASDMKLKQISATSIPVWHRLRMHLLAFRQRLIAQFRRGDVSGGNLAVISALTLGDKTMIDRHVRTLYSVSGASHVLALSGLHIAIIYTLLMLLLDGRRLFRLRIAARLLAIATVWWYVMIVGLPVSAVRSALMLSVCSVVAVANRESLSLDHLALAAFVVVAVSPMSVFDVGFQMSFIAVASILLFVPQMERLLFRSPIWQRQPMRWVSGMVTVSLAAQLGVSPLTAYYFGRFSCYFLLTNFIAIPMAMLLLYGALAMFLLSWQPVVSGLLAYGLGSAAQLLNDALALIAGLPMASIENIAISPWQVVAVYGVVVLVWLGMRMIGGYGVMRPFGMGNEP